MPLRRKPKRSLGPATRRYLRHLRGGFDGPTALLATALDLGFQQHVLDGDPPAPGLLKSRWTLEEMDALMVLRELHLAGGATDGADRWPHYIDGFVPPP